MESAPVNEEAVEEVEAVETATPASKDGNLVEEMECPEGFTQFKAAQKGNYSVLAYNFGTDLESMTELFGAEQVFEHAKANLIVRAQAVVRPLIGKGESCIDVLTSWVPGEKRSPQKIDKEAVAKNYLSNLSADELEAMLADLQG